MSVDLFVGLLVLGYVALRLFIFVFKPKDELPVQGKVIYADTEKNRRVFVSNRYKLKSKPDFLVRQDNQSLAVLEYKSRENGIYDPDVAQLITAVIAVRESMPNERISKAMVYNRSEQTQAIDVSLSDAELYAQIEPYVKMVRLIKAGYEVEVNTPAHRCARCEYRGDCHQRRA